METTFTLVSLKYGFNGTGTNGCPEMLEDISFQARSYSNLLNYYQ